MEIDLLSNSCSKKKKEEERVYKVYKKTPVLLIRVERNNYSNNNSCDLSKKLKLLDSVMQMSNISMTIFFQKVKYHHQSGQEKYFLFGEFLVSLFQFGKVLSLHLSKPCSGSLKKFVLSTTCLCLCLCSLSQISLFER